MVSPPNYSLFLIMACFWVVYFVVRSQLVKPLGALIDERERQVLAAREEIEEVRGVLEETVARCDRELATAAGSAQKERAELRAEGESVRRERLERARERGQERLAALTEELEGAANDARRELREQAETLSRELAERLLGRRLAS